jgi:hypothetical protein
MEPKNMQTDKPFSREISDEQMMELVRNALIIAGMEMGPNGDHWPVIKSTIKSVMKDWEDLKIERAVHAEMKHHLYEHLEKMESILPTCEPNVQADVAPKLKELREVYDAYFTDIDENALLDLDDTEVPMHVKRAEAIFDTLENEDV